MPGLLAPRSTATCPTAATGPPTSLRRRRRDERREHADGRARLRAPDELEATEPAGGARRAATPCACWSRAARRGELVARTGSRDLPDFLEPGDLLVVNTSATLPGGRRRHRGRRPSSCTSPPTRPTATLGGRGARAGGRGAAPRPADRRQRARACRRRRLRRPCSRPYPASAGCGWRALDLAGRCSTPGWPRTAADPLRLRRRGLADRRLPDRVRRASPGSAEMPSAGRPFTAERRDRPRRRAASSSPRSRCTPACPRSRRTSRRTPSATPSGRDRRAVNAAHAAGGRVIAVGTTVVRALETAADADGTVAPRRRLDRAGHHARARRPRGRRPAHRLARARGRPPADARSGRRPRRCSSLATTRALAARLPLARVRRRPPDRTMILVTGAGATTRSIGSSPITCRSRSRAELRALTPSSPPRTTSSCAARASGQATPRTARGRRSSASATPGIPCSPTIGCATPRRTRLPRAADRRAP